MKYDGDKTPAFIGLNLLVVVVFIIGAGLVTNTVFPLSRQLAGSQMQENTIRQSPLIDTVKCTEKQAFCVVLCPNPLVIAGQVSKGSVLSYEASFSIKNECPDTLALMLIEAAPPLKIDYKKDSLILPMTKMDVKLKFIPERPGTVCGRITVKLKNLAAQKDSSISVFLPYCGIGLAPQIAVDRDTIKFGDVAIGVPAKVKKLHVRNVGNDTLKITNIDSSIIGDSVFTLIYPKLPWLIAPQRTDSMAIQFKPDSIGNNQRHSFDMISNSYNNKSLTIQLLGNGFTGPGIEFELESIAFDTCLGTTQTKAVKLRNSGTASLTVTRIDSPFPDVLPAPPITVPITIDSGNAVTLFFSFMPKEMKSLSGRYIAHSNRKGGDSTLFVTARADTASFRVAPTKELLEPIVAVVGDTKSAAFFIDNASRCPLFIDTIYVQSESGAFQVSVRKDTVVSPYGQIYVWVSFAPRTPSLDSALVFIVSKYPESSRTLKVKGQGLPGAIFVLDPSQLDFGEVCVGKDSTLKVRVRNEGHKTMAIRDIVRTGSSAFAIHPKPAAPKDSIRIGPGGEHIFAVTYEPSTEKTDSATFEFLTSRADGDKRLFVQGQGIRVELSAEPPKLSFGKVEVDDDSTLTITLTNKSTHPIRIFDARIVPDEGVFTVSPKSGNLPPNSSLALIVAFKPSLPKEYKADLVIEHNADCADDSVPLEGTGVAPVMMSIRHSVKPCTLLTGDSIVLTAVFKRQQRYKPDPDDSLHYRIGGALDFAHMLMQAIDETTSSATIPGSAVGHTGIEYFFTGRDEKGKFGVAPAKPQLYVIGVRLPQGISHSTPLHFGTAEQDYRMISVPVIMDDSSAANVLKSNGFHDFNNGITWRFFDYYEGSLREYGKDSVRAFRPGRAYWLITAEFGRTFQSGPGSAVATSSAGCPDAGQHNRIELEPGWNMIANPFNFPIPKESLHVVGDSTIISDQVLAYEGGWEMAPPMLEPWTGYALKLGKEAQVTFNPQSVRSGSPERRDKPGDWTIQIIARTGRHEDAINFIGVRADAQDQWDAHDLFEPPPIGAGVSLAFPHADWVQNPDNYTGDFRAAFADGAMWEFQVKTALKEPSTTLLFKNLQNVPGNLEIQLYDKNRGVVKDLRRQDHYIYSELGALLPGRFELIVGTPAFTEVSTAAVKNVPEVFELYPNFPNPFNNETIISFSLPNAVPVWLKIFDVMGREVRVLSDGKVWEKGRNYLRWEGSDQSGNKVGSGFYILSLQSGEFKRQKRIILLR